ncbi:hypothetical protein [Allgaiera indica]|uniref:hypothetical protein n=1 Tax=Allgaiera indica TaxID=765699 RepID=UPI00115FF379|nr:hypothetical protein [Allgaiera indica]
MALSHHSHYYSYAASQSTKLDIRRRRTIILLLKVGSADKAAVRRRRDLRFACDGLRSEERKAEAHCEYDPPHEQEAKLTLEMRLS